MTPLGRWFLSLARTFATTLFDDGRAIPEDRLDWLIADFADFTAHTGMKTRMGLRGTLFLLQILPLFFIGVPLLMTWLSPAQRLRYLAKVEESRVSFIVTSVKAPLTILYFEHPDVLPRTGYDGESLVPGSDETRALRAPSKAGFVKLLTASEKRS